jgi:hypothetical protein
VTNANVNIPRSPRLPSDLSMLLSTDPMTLTLRALGGQARVDAAHAAHIAGLITSALTGAL